MFLALQLMIYSVLFNVCCFIVTELQQH